MRTRVIHMPGLACHDELKRLFPTDCGNNHAVLLPSGFPLFRDWSRTVVNTGLMRVGLPRPRVDPAGQFVGNRVLGPPPFQRDRNVQAKAILRDPRGRQPAARKEIPARLHKRTNTPVIIAKFPRPDCGIRAIPP
jgi:hypothetical protein